MSPKAVGSGLNQGGAHRGGCELGLEGGALPQPRPPGLPPSMWSRRATDPSWPSVTCGRGSNTRRGWMSPLRCVCPPRPFLLTGAHQEPPVPDGRMVSWHQPPRAPCQQTLSHGPGVTAASRLGGVRGHISTQELEARSEQSKATASSQATSTRIHAYRAPAYRTQGSAR